MAVHVRAVEERDHEAVHAILTSRAVLDEPLPTPQHPRHAHVGEINLVATHPDAGRKGVGRALMEAMIDLAARGVTRG